MVAVVAVAMVVAVVVVVAAAVVVMVVEYSGCVTHLPIVAVAKVVVYVLVRHLTLRNSGCR